MSSRTIKNWFDDAEVFGAIADLGRSRAAFANALARCDRVAAKQEGRVIIDADEKELEAAMEQDARAFERLLTLVPQSLAGIRALLDYSTGECIMADEDRVRLARSLLASPALRPGMTSHDRWTEPGCTAFEEVSHENVI